jgi:hypothetical protein
MPYTISLFSASGYPLFCITYKIASLLIPFFGVAWRMNFFNALLTAAAAAVISCTSLRLSRSLPAAVFSGLLYALCETGWHFALHAEVFALNSLTTAIAMFVLLRYMQHPSQLWCALGAHAFCVGLANQHTIVLLLPPVAAGVLMRDASVCLAWSTIRHCFFAALVGASFYMYPLPIRTLFSLFVPLFAHYSHATCFPVIFLSRHAAAPTSVGATRTRSLDLRG